MSVETVDIQLCRPILHFLHHMSVPYFVKQCIHIYFLNLLALLSANLGVVNLMPIPGLDGAAFLASIYETISRRKAPAKVINIIKLVGLILLLLLMGVIIIKDIVMLF